MNINIELKRKMSHPKIGSKQRLVGDYGPLAEAFTIWLIQWIWHLAYASRMENS